MRDISAKTTTLRIATAKATIRVSPRTIGLIRKGKIPKGDPIPVARVAAIQAAKNTSQIIPYCHPIPIDHVECRFEFERDAIEITTQVKAIYKTGVEMEALTAASVAALTIYDMAKAVDEEMEIVGVKLISKKGGKSDFRRIQPRSIRAGVVVMSDSVAAGKKEDLSGRVIQERLKSLEIKVADYKVIPDDPEMIDKELRRLSDKLKLDIVLTTGGTGLGPRDNSPDSTGRLLEKEIPGIAETLRAHGQSRMPFAMLSRGKAGVRGKTIIVNLPGSRRAVEESLDVLFPALLHVLRMMEGEGH
ncbi:MAG TPA: bifunctional molybdenum cofactor biosynthesis protein MoaC/MoaB [Bacteroidota bacterium]|nr:bifunctional molybdenum cofactor biosynthesis protein MoaC/MoaB [Bacteroidota bacterium]